MLRFMRQEDKVILAVAVNIGRCHGIETLWPARSLIDDEAAAARNGAIDQWDDLIERRQLWRRGRAINHISPAAVRFEPAQEPIAPRRAEDEIVNAVSVQIDPWSFSQHSKSIE